MWELYVLFMFSSENVADKVTVLTLEGVDDLPTSLRNFDILSAHCFDPNEEMKIQRVIHAGGVDEFCRALRILGRQISASQSKQDAVMQRLLSENAIFKAELVHQRALFETSFEMLHAENMELKELLCNMNAEFSKNK